ncbi:MAG: four helix bundle protein [Stygiobacter sp. RIFOXYC12_FULL_38_8]|nr:MAG: four helix bundle protein [Stygiobacter sp. GWC2_38_9]OGV09736.1 MAG: four helix bundle protein [Stygiobacter sp. RIFOXYB2_FULL_37_11]OGV13603.1 MAG: four helix bundle protein [Stygiobacter sp. RIFOXYC2_FULL_38_25]OGV16107.1 MAG: four helix bundle protein [Stygiobacter sp. RIFOXYA2_FULL_38_8]OGV27400.1 MAG: four helix bundle protein [Stygiobacter sp. RIFOXYC12_FULL_38_8]OGV79987.1 MAG: four helix bundle protein [Stygiobacter sp. GWF2_38_21]RJQ58050.1 MAG: four helix bundle protein [St
MKVLEPLVNYSSILYQKAFGFSIRIVKLYKHLLQKDKSYEPLYKQLLRSGTSIGANVSEAQSAPTKKDFINKLSISLKESRETEYWIRLLKETEIINQQEHDSLIKDCDELERLLTSSIKTAREN